VINGGARASCKTDQSLLRAVARAHCWFDDLVTPGGYRIMGQGVYEDDLVKVNGEWKILRRRVKNDHLVSDPAKLRGRRSRRPGGFSEFDGVTLAGLGALNKRNKTSDNYSGRKSAAPSRNKNTAAGPGSTA
jgi:hypothetical protein